ncbi:MarR family winged helix-turn-helix transcriptional regulator [Deinococcus humi]|uniref:DNA-binding MarR family transcriptional regulator n=1 Tax=Deinococcus humi TaxID=662880 RepID=A0A7W8JXQ6_9DEIO|nr:MarR family transcriptional regulator [Deinococcus humi]MBB5365120.1 DNA-binding MarR family transcriptional regulator [Deinococcus humi]GGO37890.1 MarR family transcriptional regulator [Deinococcus humi]
MTPASTQEQDSPLPLSKDTVTLLNRIEQDWQRMRPELDATPMLTGLLLDRLGNAFARHIEQTYSEEGINPSNWDLLLTLLRSAPPQGLTHTELSELTAISGPSMTNRVTRLLDKGLVERVVSEKDRRSALVRLTPQGRELVERLLPQHLEREQQALSVLSGEELNALTAIARKLVEHLEGGLAAEDTSAQGGT